MAGDTGDTGDGLTLESFALCLLLVAARGKMMLAKKNGRTAAIQDKLGFLLEKHLWPHAMPRNNDMFYAMCYDPGMASCLSKYERLLRAVFQSYSSMGIASISALRNRQRNRASCTVEPAAPVLAATAQRATLDLSGMEAMLDHAGLFVGPLDQAAFRGLFRGVQQCGLDSDDDDDSEESDSDKSGSDSDSSSTSSSTSSEEEEEEETVGRAVSGSMSGDREISYQEFIDLLVAIALYRDPNLFHPFIERFESLVVHGLLGPLKRYWASKADDGSGGGLVRLLELGLDEVARAAKAKEEELEAAAAAGGPRRGSGRRGSARRAVQNKE
eukprot:SRR837773.20826.p1 GENE.SRR837773.20826~~SRR837773.20826.p1  ORF type:complete len:371 (-),score=90.76 SRR837773.20826:31-1014(-)